MVRKSLVVCCMITISVICLLVWGKVIGLLQDSKVVQQSTGAEVNNDMFMEAISSGDLGKFKAMVEAGQDVHAVGFLGINALNRSIMNGHLGIVTYLLGAGADASLQDDSGDTSLHYAVRYGKYDIIDELTKHGYDINSLNDDGETPMVQMFDAFDTSNDDLINMYKFLTARGADPKIEDNLGFTVLTHGHMTDKLEFISYLQRIGLHGDIQTKAEANDALHKLGINNEDEYGRAIVFNTYGLVKVFLLAGYNPNIEASDGTPNLIGLATGTDYAKMIDLLLQHGADPDYTNEYGSTMLFEAAFMNNPELVKVLLKHGAEDLHNKAGYNAWMVAKEDGHHEIVALLEESQKQRKGVETVDSKEKREDDEIVVDVVQSFVESGLIAIKENNFSLVEGLLDPAGPAFKQSQNSIKYVNRNNFSQKLLHFQALDVSKLDDQTYQVSTYEKYMIAYESGRTETNGYNSTYIVTLDMYDQPMIHEILHVEKVYSE